MKKNYKSWDINIEDFYKLNSPREKLVHLIKFGILAPSGHNSQPWRFSIVEDNKINVYIDSSRKLAVSDSNNRQTYISIGCVIKNITIAADYYGYKYFVDYKNPFNNDLVATISLTPGHKKEIKGHLIYSILQRVTNRGKYKNKKIPQAFQDKLQTLVPNDIQLCFITDDDIKVKIAVVCLDAMAEAMEDKRFRIELSKYFKNNKTFSKIGMPGSGMGIPTILSFIVPTLIKYKNITKMNRKTDEDVFISKTPSYLLISTSKDEPQAWLKVGEFFEEAALLATKEGISIAPWQAPVQIGQFYKIIQKITGTYCRPQFLARMGYALTDANRSPRVPVEETIN